MVGHRPENLEAENFYTALGFKDTGERFKGEIVRCLILQ